MDIVARLRRMSDMTTTDNDLQDIARAADEIERLRVELQEAKYGPTQSEAEAIQAEAAALEEVEKLKAILEKLKVDHETYRDNVATIARINDRVHEDQRKEITTLRALKDKP